MKFFLVASAIVFGSIANSQNQPDAVKFRRSSLTMVLLENDDLGKNKEMVTKSYYANPFPDKYNNHVLSDKVFNPAKMKLDKFDYLKSGFYKDTLKTMKDFLLAKKKIFNTIRYVAADSSRAVLEPSKEELTNIYIDKYIRDKNLAKQMVSTWFNRKSDGSMDWEYLKEKALYSAREDEKSDQSKQALTDKLIKDIDIIGNTFIVFNRLNFFANEPVARIVRDLAKAEAVKNITIPMALEKANKGIDAVYEKTKEGYTVICNTYLYQLDWNEEVAKKTQQYFFSDNVDKLKTWDTTNLYNLKFVGKTNSSSIVTFKIGEKRTEAQIIDLQVKRTIDNSMAKLQKEYMVFRTVTPISTINPITAQIGTKEGVEAGQTFEILKSEEGADGIPHWNSIGKVKVSKKIPVWDNSNGAEPQLDDKGVIIEVPKCTTFEGGKNANELMFLRLLK